MSTSFWFIVFSLPAFALVGLGVHPILVAVLVAGIATVLAVDVRMPIIQIIIINPYRSLPA